MRSVDVAPGGLINFKSSKGGLIGGRGLNRERGEGGLIVGGGLI